MVNLFLWHLVFTKRHIAITNSVGLSVLVLPVWVLPDGLRR